MDISVSVALIAGLMFVNTVFLIPLVVKAIKAFSEAQKLLEMTRLQMPPILHDVTRIIGEADSTIQSIHKGVDTIGDSLTHVKVTARSIKEFEAMVQERIEKPLLEITSVLSALVVGGRVFWRHFTKG